MPHKPDCCDQKQLDYKPRFKAILGANLLSLRKNQTSRAEQRANQKQKAAPPPLHFLNVEISKEVGHQFAAVY